MGFIWGFYGVFDILLSDFGSWWYTIHEYMVLWGVYGIFMVYFTTFVYSLSAPWRVYLHKKFSDSCVFIWYFTAFVYTLCSVQRSTNADAQQLIRSAWFDKNGQKPRGDPIRPLHRRLYFRDTLVKLYAQISTLNHYPQNLLFHNITES